VGAAGAPEQIARNAKSYTGAYLRAALARRTGKRGRAAAQ
jgi:excinuclease UvrABC ATPase subunit